MTNIDRLTSRLTSVVEKRRKEREIESNYCRTSGQERSVDKEASDGQARTAGNIETTERNNRKQSFTPMSDTGIFC